VVVSLGEEFSSVPELFGESMRGARLLIERSGLRVGAVVRAPSDDVGEGLIAGSDPGPETVLPRETAVHLLISAGPRLESYVMPDLAGREIGGVRRQLEALGFRVLTPPGGGSHGTVASQAPAAGSRISRETQIVLQATGRMIR
jgi:beta-lactam-binding protein with PASTA domain